MYMYSSRRYTASIYIYMKHAENKNRKSPSKKNKLNFNEKQDYLERSRFIVLSYLSIAILSLYPTLINTEKNFITDKNCKETHGYNTNLLY